MGGGVYSGLQFAAPDVLMFICYEILKVICYDNILNKSPKMSEKVLCLIVSLCHILSPNRSTQYHY